MIDNLLAELPTMNEHMNRWSERFARRYYALQSGSNKYMWWWAKTPTDTQIPPAHQKAYQQTREETGLDELHPIYTFLDNLCDAYLKADDDQRKRARKELFEQKALMAWIPSYITGLTEQIESGGDSMLFRRALAALSMENATIKPGVSPRYYEDYRMIFTSLDPLKGAARNAGINIDSYLREVAELSSKEPSWLDPKSVSMRDYLFQAGGGI